MDQTSTAPSVVEYISIAAPAYNEAAGIKDVVLTWHTFLKNLDGLREFEIIVCNDGSKDNTGALLDELADTYPEIKPLHLKINQGAAAALSLAIKKTRYSWVLLIDSDGQYGVDTTTALISSVEEKKNKAAIGVRIKKHDSALTRFGSWSSGKLCNLFHGSHYRDFNCALKLVDGSILRSLALEAKGLNYSTEITSRLIEAGVQMSEVEVEHNPRKTGKSSANSKAIWHRILFVAFLGYRQYLLKRGVIKTYRA